MEEDIYLADQYMSQAADQEDESEISPLAKTYKILRTEGLDIKEAWQQTLQEMDRARRAEITSGRLN